MYGAPYIFYFVHSIVKTVEMMVQRVDFERNLKNIRPVTVHLKAHMARDVYPKRLLGQNVTIHKITLQKNLLELLIPFQVCGFFSS